jgi:fructokinase
MRYGGIEAGGTKWVCGVGTSPSDLETITIPTRGPSETMREAAEFFRGKGISALGIGSFGPLDLKAGRIVSTPKLAWQGTDLVGEFSRALDIPVRLETDVNAAALGEARWGAARGVSDFVYLTVGTGVGGGVMVSGRLVHGVGHPEIGHLPIPHDLATDPFRGNCPFHGDCLEGLASGTAIRERWGVAGEDLPKGHPGWELEARYLARGVASLAYTLSPELVILGGGVMRRSELLGMVEREVGLVVNGYVRVPEIRSPGLGELSGVAGAVALASAVS